MNISEVAIRNPVFSWMIMAAFIFFGAIAFTRLGVSLYPDVDYPNVTVRVNYPGAAPEVVERDVLDEIEGAVTSIEDIRQMTTTARVGSGKVKLEFSLNKDIDVAVQEVQSALGRIQRNLPRDVEAPSVLKSNSDDRPVVWLAVTSAEMERRDLMILVRDRVRDQFSTLPGVGEIFLGGFVAPAMRVDVDIQALNSLELSIQDVIQSIQSGHIERPAGSIETEVREDAIRVLGELGSSQDFESLAITRRGGSPSFRPIALREIAEIYPGLDATRRISRVNGESSVGLGIRKQRGANTVAVVDAVRERMTEVQASLPEGVNIRLNSDSSVFIRDSVRELLFTLGLAALLTALVCWLFLGSWFAVLNVLMAIPTAVIGTFIFLYLFDFTLNTFTLLALALCIGIIVDDAIIMLENITRHREEGRDKMRAALLGSRQILFAVVVTTIVLVAIFLPVAFMDGIVGKFFFQFGVTIAIAVSISSIEALTLSPMRCSRYLTLGERKTRFGRGFEALMKRLIRNYDKALRVVLHHRWKTLAGSLGIFAALFSAFFLLDREYMPAQDESSLRIDFQTPDGSSIQHTNQKLLEVESAILDWPYMERYFVAVGGFGGNQPNAAVMFMTLKPPRERPLSSETGRRPNQEEVANLFLQKMRDFEGVRAFIPSGGTRLPGSRSGSPVEFAVRGPDWEDLTDQASRLIAALEATGQFQGLNSRDLNTLPEFRVIPDREAALASGVDIESISNSVQALFGGVVPVLYSEGGRRMDVRVQLRDDDRSSLESLNQVFVRNNRGELVALSRVVQVEAGEGPQTIFREDRQRSIRVSANLSEGINLDTALQTVFDLAETELSPGYFVVLSGSSADFQEGFRSLFVVMLLGILIAYMVLASQFNSFTDPLSILMSLPFSFSGAFLSLWLLGQTLNIYSFIGLILLMGIVTKNGILLIDFTNQFRDQGKNMMEALTEACPLRLRPILMTTCSTLAAALPAALALGPGSETRMPMAIGIIGGVIVSTSLTLFIVPVIYSFVSEKRIARTPKTELIN